MENITKELIETIYKRALEYSIAAFGKDEPDTVEIKDNGVIKVVWYFDCGSEDEWFSFNELNSNLDDVYAERKLKEDEQRKKIEEYNKKQEEIKKQREYEEKRALYEKLKKEFELNNK